MRKAMRYIKLYGFSRTLVKIKGQYHMRAAAEFDGAKWVNPDCNKPDRVERHVALIGCGLFAFSNIAYYLGKSNPNFLRCAFDLHKNRALSLCKSYGGAYVIEDWREILSDQNVKVVFIASNHASHADYAIACIKAGKHVHIEKPHVVSQEQLDRLVSTMRLYPKVKVFLGYNRPRSPLFAQLQKFLSRESGPLMINWFIAGHAIPDGHWYFDEKEGGRILGNLSHWSDLTLHLVSLEKAFPCKIVPASPPDAKSEFVLTVVFADRSCAAITFSAKGDTFEGVREILNIHKGNVLATLTDFHKLTVDVIEQKNVIHLRHRDHGHEANIVHSLACVTEDGVLGEDISYIAATAKFALAIRQSIHSGETVCLSLEHIMSSSE
jgi:predicted dehydrogenase